MKHDPLKAIDEIYRQWAGEHEPGRGDVENLIERINRIEGMDAARNRKIYGTWWFRPGAAEGEIWDVDKLIAEIKAEYDDTT